MRTDPASGHFQQRGSVTLRLPGNPDYVHVAGFFRFDIDSVRRVPDRGMEKEKDPAEMDQEYRQVIPTGIVRQFMQQNLSEFRIGEFQDTPGRNQDHGSAQSDQYGARELIGNPQRYGLLHTQFGQAAVKQLPHAGDGDRNGPPTAPRHSNKRGNRADQS